MPVQYTPQFIPTNTQALQGVLSEYQRAYDQNLSRELEVQDQYSMIPTVGAEDTIYKNQAMSKFASSLADLEKKYNYDRASSAYSKELARKISDLRKDEFWGYNERKKSTMDLEQKMKAQLGANYFSKVNPSEVSFNNRQMLDQYTPMDTRDLAQIVGSTAKEKATSITQSIRNLVSINNPLTGKPEPFAELGEQLGYKDDASAASFLNSEAGQKWLDESLAATPFAEFKDDPQIRAIAMQSAMQNLVGERRTSFSRMDIPSSSNTKSPFGSTSPGVKRDVPIHDAAQTYSATKGAKLLNQGTANYTPTEREIIQEGINSASLSTTPAASFLKLPSNVMTWIATSLIPNKNKSNIDEQSVGYIYEESLKPRSENDPIINQLSGATNISSGILKRLGVSDVDVNEFTQKAILYNMTGGEKNAPIKALEEITGRDFSRKDVKDLSRDWNTWWESGGNSIKDRFASTLDERRQKRVNKRFNWDTKNAENQMTIDYMKGEAKFFKPVFFGESKLDSGTKGLVTNENMTYFDAEKISAFMSEAGNYDIEYSLSGDDTPVFGITSPSGKTVNFAVPLERLESIGGLANYAAAFGDASIGNDITASSFNPPIGNVISAMDSSLENALINTYTYSSMLSGNLDNLAEDTEIIKSNATAFFDEYEIRKTINDATFEVRKKGTDKWSGRYPKQELLRVVANPNLLEQ